jgi:hypothetical protein
MHDLNSYTEDELIERAWVLHDHNVSIANDPAYMVRYMQGELPDPFEDYEPGDPWFSEWAIEDHLGERMAVSE